MTVAEKKKRYGIVLPPRIERLCELESFVLACPLLSEEEKNRAVIIAGEYFDNIISHGSGMRNEKVWFAIEQADCVRLLFRYTCGNFSELIEYARRLSAEEVAARVFDRKTGRYRGLGLKMCRNLSKNIQYVCGLHKQTVIISL